MTATRLSAIVLAVLLLYVGRASQAQKVVLEPAGWTSTSDKNPDLRLSQKISYEVWHTPVKIILSDLSQAAGVKLKAGASSQDWQIRDRKMNIYVRDITLAELMDSIARVMKFKWEKYEKDDPPTYRLYADRRLLGKLQREANKRERELKQEVMKRRAGLVETFEEIGALSDEEILKLKEENPYLYICAETGFAKLVTQIFSEFPGLRETFIRSHKNVQIRTSLMSPTTQQLYIDVLRKNDKYYRPKADSPDNLESQVQEGCAAQLEAMPRRWEWAARAQLSDFGNLGSPITTPGDPPRAVHHRAGTFRNPDAEVAKLSAKIDLEAGGQRSAVEQLYKQHESQLKTAHRKTSEESEYYLMFDPVIEHPDELDFHKKVIVKISEQSEKHMEEQAKALGGAARSRLQYQSVQKAIADAAEMSVVSDSFAVVVGAYEPSETEDELATVLDQFAGEYGCNWEKQGSVIEFRRRDWFRRRASQIPDEWVHYWRDEVDQVEVLSLESYGRIITLSQEQIEENIDSEPVLSKAIGIFWEPAENEGLMRFYLQLTPMQRRAIFSDEGLDASMLSITQWPYYAEMFDYRRRTPWWGSEVFSNPGDNRVVIKANTRTGAKGELELLQETGGVQYNFSVILYAADETKTDGWAIDLPRVPRPADKPAAESGGKP